MMAADHLWCQVSVLAPDGSPLATVVVRGAGRPGLEVVDALARLTLESRRQGGDVVVSALCVELAELLELCGLPGEVRRKTEHGEEALGVEKGVDPDDPIT
jgi:hypothetical protein